jgi:hypothetical protein
MNIIHPSFKKHIFFLALILIYHNGFSQQKINNNLFKSDSAIVYLGVVNQFKINPGEKIDLVGETKGVRIKQKDGILEIKAQSIGIFPISFKTDIGLKKVVLVSKALSVEQIKSGVY